jgi:O-acetyl-ADP-ribose deacetylase (regulator of RNase III)
LLRLTISGRATITLKQGDITREQVDAIVNAANSSLMGGGGVDGAIHRIGGRIILDECRQIRESRLPEGLPAGQAVATSAGNLPAGYVIHTVGPVWHGGKSGEPELLASCYRESIHVAAERKLTSIAFPAISTGVFGYPKDAAAKIAINTIVELLRGGSSPVADVRFIVFDAETYDIYEAKLKSLAGPEIQLESMFAP